jgi:hypothetical protein
MADEDVIATAAMAAKATMKSAVSSAISAHCAQHFAT